MAYDSEKVPLLFFTRGPLVFHPISFDDEDLKMEVEGL